MIVSADPNPDDERTVAPDSDRFHGLQERSSVHADVLADARASEWSVVAESLSFSVPAQVVSGDASLRASYAPAWEQRQVVLRLVLFLTYNRCTAARTGGVVSCWQGLLRGVSGPDPPAS